jgi:hypothetical protein
MTMMSKKNGKGKKNVSVFAGSKKIKWTTLSQRKPTP